MFGQVGTLLIQLTIFLSSVVTLFLFFRAARKEFFEKELIFDLAFVSILFALVFGRLVDFLTRSSFYSWSVKKLIFFNVYPGIDPWGAFLGGFLAAFWFLRLRLHNKVWQILDLACAPLAFGMSLVSLGLWMAEHKIVYMVLFWGYFVIFWAIKRLEKVRRHFGFFVCFFFVFVSLLNLGLLILSPNSKLLFGKASFNFVTPAALAIIFSFFWYLASKRKLKDDLRGLFAALFLGSLKLRRILTSTSEANNISKSIILFPYNLAKVVYFLVLLTGREIYLSMSDLLKAFGFKKR